MDLSNPKAFADNKLNVPKIVVEMPIRLLVIQQTIIHFCFLELVSTFQTMFVTNTLLYTNIPRNQSDENAGVAFFKGANEGNEFFEKINKQ